MARTKKGKHPDKGDYTFAERLLGVRSQGIIPGHNESCSSQKPSLQDLSWLGCERTPQGRVLRQINHGGQSKVIGLKEDKDPECYSCIKDLNFPKAVLSLSWPLCFSRSTDLFSKFFNLLFKNKNKNIGVDKEDLTLTYNGILLSHEKEQNNAICSNIDGPRDYNTKLSQSDRERQISYDITYMWNIKLGCK